MLCIPFRDALLHVINALVLKLKSNSLLMQVIYNFSCQRKLICLSISLVVSLMVRLGYQNSMNELYPTSLGKRMEFLLICNKSFIPLNEGSMVCIISRGSEITNGTHDSLHCMCEYTCLYKI